MGARAPVPVGDPAALAAALDQALDGRLPAVSGHAMLAYGIQTACDAHATFFAGLMQHASAPDADAPIMSQPSTLSHPDRIHPGYRPASSFSGTIGRASCRDSVCQDV